MGEDDDLFKATSDLINQNSSSIKSSDIRNSKGIIDNQQLQQNTVTKIAYGKGIIPITKKFAMNCKRDRSQCMY